MENFYTHSDIVFIIPIQWEVEQMKAYDDWKPYFGVTKWWNGLRRWTTCSCGSNPTICYMFHLQWPLLLFLLPLLVFCILTGCVCIKLQMSSDIWPFLWRFLAAECIGKIGAVDPGKLDFANSQQVTQYTFTKFTQVLFSLSLNE